MLRLFSVCMILSVCLARPSSEISQEPSELEEVIDTWLTKTDRNERKIETLHQQIEEIGDVLENQQMMIEKVEELVSFGLREKDQNQMKISNEEEELQEPFPYPGEEEEELETEEEVGQTEEQGEEESNNIPEEEENPVKEEKTEKDS